MNKDRLQELAGIDEAHVSHFEDLPSGEEKRRTHAIGAISINYAKGLIALKTAKIQLEKAGLTDKEINHLLGTDNK